MIDLSWALPILGAISSIAVIAGAVFIVFQLRQNARLIQATIKENRTNSSISLLEKLTEDSFARRRKLMYDAVKKYSATNWERYDDTLEDFEVRNFAYIYELIGQLARQDLIDVTAVKNAMQYLIVLDWEVFEPLNKHYIERFRSVSEGDYRRGGWSNFEWLAKETLEHLIKDGRGVGQLRERD